MGVVVPIRPLPCYDQTKPPIISGPKRGVATQRGAYDSGRMWAKGQSDPDGFHDEWKNERMA